MTIHHRSCITVGRPSASLEQLLDLATPLEDAIPQQAQSWVVREKSEFDGGLSHLAARQLVTGWTARKG